MRNGPYELVVAPDNYPGKKYRKRYCYEHHLVYWKHYGIIPSKDEIVHHINEKHRDNKIINLQLMKKVEHSKHHGNETRVAPIEHACANCNKHFLITRKNLKTRLKQSKTGNLFCSRSCQVKTQKKELKLKRCDVPELVRDHTVNMEYVRSSRTITAKPNVGKNRING